MKAAKYEPRGAARDLFLCRDDEILIEGPAGTGKTRAILEKAYLCAMKYDGARILLVRKTRASMTESVLVTLEEKVIPDGHPAKHGASRRMRQSYDLDNGSSIVLCGMDHSEKIMSTEFDMVCAFEATELTEHDWERAISRLRNGVMPYQQAIADCNPSTPNHWLNRRAATDRMTRMLSRHRDNPTLWSMSDWTLTGQAYLGKLQRLTGPRFDRLFLGKWSAAEGLVYQTYDPAIHLVDRFTIPDDWRRIVSIDFGYTNPFVCQWWAIDPDGRMVLYREMYTVGLLVEDAARQILGYTTSESIEAFIADHDAEGRATLERYGISTIPAHKAITTGIDAVRSRLAPAGDGKPRLHIMRDACIERDPQLVDDKKPIGAAEEMESYVYPPGRHGRSENEVPVKEHDHAMDAMRYAVAYLDHLGALPLGII